MQNVTSCPLRLSDASRKAFTLLEVLVATAVLALVSLVLVRVADTTARVTTLSHQRIGADSGGRQALDRIGVDFSGAILRPDLPSLVEKVAGNDRITFFVQADGCFTPPVEQGDARGISKISYDAPENILRRGAEGTRWEGGSGTLVFNAGAVTPVADQYYEIASDNVFRFEFAFLLQNGKIVASVDSLNNKDGDSGKSVRAIIVGVAALEQQARVLLESESASQGGGSKTLADLMAKFPDARDGEDILTTWDGALDESGFPSPVVNGVRIYQRYFILTD